MPVNPKKFKVHRKGLDFPLLFFSEMDQYGNKWMRLVIINKMNPWSKDTPRNERLIESFSRTYDELIDVHFFPYVSEYAHERIEKYKKEREQDQRIPPYYDLIIRYFEDLEHKMLNRPFHFWECK